jgi:hypothetical protein
MQSMNIQWRKELRDLRFCANGLKPPLAAGAGGVDTVTLQSDFNSTAVSYNCNECMQSMQIERSCEEVIGPPAFLILSCVLIALLAASRDRIALSRSSKDALSSCDERGAACLAATV